jgi:hypothetical protein
MTLATMGWGALFIKQSVLAGQPTGTQFKIRFDDGKAFVSLGKRESVYNIVGESSPPSARTPDQAVSDNNTGKIGAPLSLAVPPASNLSATLNFSSLPSGADIDIDGAFVGNTPSAIEVPSGEHIVTIGTKGFIR